jgi:hypothetical protein
VAPSARDTSVVVLATRSRSKMSSEVSTSSSERLVAAERKTT